MRAPSADAPPPGSPWPTAVGWVRARLERAFDELLGWCAIDDALADARPAPEAWTAREVLEHVVLANRFLGLLVEKIADRSGRRAARGSTPEPGSPALRELDVLATLPWRHPEHMTPTGERALDAIARDLEADRARFLAILAAHPAGEGSLHRIRMSVVGERLDLYQYLAVIALHAQRHVGQLERNRKARA